MERNQGLIATAHLSWWFVMIAFRRERVPESVPPKKSLIDWNYPPPPGMPVNTRIIPFCLRNPELNLQFVTGALGGRPKVLMLSENVREISLDTHPSAIPLAWWRLKGMGSGEWSLLHCCWGITLRYSKLCDPGSISCCLFVAESCC